MNRFGKSVLLSFSALLITLVLFSCKSGAEKAANGEGIALKLNFKPGDKYLYTTQVNQKVNSFNAVMDQTMVMEMIYAQSGDDGDNKKLNITYDHVLIKMSTPLGETKYDSRETGNKEPDFAFMDKLIGKSFNITVTPNGDIAKVDGLNELISSLSATGDNDVRAALESQFSDTAVKLMMQNSFDMYPGKEVKVGESWSKKSTMSLSGVSVNVENTYTFKSIDHDKATISIVSVMNLPPTNMQGNAGVPMQMEMNGKQDGIVEMEVNSGQILSGKTTQQIDGKITAEGQSLPMSITGEITISSKKL